MKRKASELEGNTDLVDLTQDDDHSKDDSHTVGGSSSSSNKKNSNNDNNDKNNDNNNHNQPLNAKQKKYAQQMIKDLRSRIADNPEQTIQLISSTLKDFYDQNQFRYMDCIICELKSDIKDFGLIHYQNGVYLIQKLIAEPTSKRDIGRLLLFRSLQKCRYDLVNVTLPKQSTLLIEAVKAENFYSLTILYDILQQQSSFDINAVDEDGYSALLHAAKLCSKDVSILRFLLERKGIDHSKLGYDGASVASLLSSKHQCLLTKTNSRTTRQQPSSSSSSMPAAVNSSGNRGASSSSSSSSAAITSIVTIDPKLSTIVFSVSNNFTISFETLELQMNKCVSIDEKMTLLSLLITQLEGKKGFLDCVTPIFVKYRTLVEPNLHLLISTKTNEPIILRQIKAGYIKLIQMLHNELKYNLQIIPGLPESTSMLIEAVKHQHLRVVTYLLHEIQVDVHYKDEKGNTALMYASETAVDIIKCLTSHYHTVEEIPFDTLPETHHDVILVQWQKTSIPVYSIDLFFEFLVESTPACVMWMQEYSKLDPKEQSRVLKPNPEDDQQQQNGEPMDLSTIKSKSNKYILQYIIETHNLAFLHIVMRICFPINVDNYAFMPERVSLLMYAVKCGFLEGCLMLIDNFGANIHQQDIHGNTAIIYAAMHHREKYVHFLHKKGAKLSVVSKDGVSVSTFYPQLDISKTKSLPKIAWQMKVDKQLRKWKLKIREIVRNETQQSKVVVSV